MKCKQKECADSSPVSDSVPLRGLKKSGIENGSSSVPLRAFHWAEARSAFERKADVLFTAFLQRSESSTPVIVRSDIDDRTAIGTMQAFKDREPESVRWRSVTEHVNDVDLMTQLADMRVHAEQNTEFVDLRVLLPSSASKQTVHHFIEHLQLAEWPVVR